MSIKKYTNFESINDKSQNEGQFLQMDDLFIVSKNQIEEADFGDCKYDVMEVSVYDINNNLLPHKSGKNVAYIKKIDIKDYLYSITNKGGQKELAINIEKLLNDLGFTNGILKVNINFVRQRVGSDNELQRVWIHEISPSREEIRIIPLKTKDENINQITKNEFKNINNLNKDFKYYKKNILDSLDLFEAKSLTTIDDIMFNKFGNDFIQTLRKDFGVRNFSQFRTKIFENFRDSINNWLNNRYYDITQSTFGKPSEARFDDCDQYDFNYLMSEVRNILNICVSANIKSLKKRTIEYTQVPKEFAVVELRKQIQDNLASFQTKVDIKRNIYSPDKVDVNIKGTSDLPPIVEVIQKDVVIDILPDVIILPPPPREEPPLPEEPSPRRKPSVEVVELPPTESVDITPSYGGGGGGGGGQFDTQSLYENGRGFGGQRDIAGRESIQNFQ